MATGGVTPKPNARECRVPDWLERNEDHPVAKLKGSGLVDETALELCIRLTAVVGEDGGEAWACRLVAGAEWRVTPVAVNELVGVGDLSTQ
jgi:hypothetical protein